MHRAVVPVAAAVLLLAGCGSGSSGGSALPTVGASSGTTTPPVSPTETASATPTVDPSPWTALPTRDVGPNKGVYSGVVLASSVAKTDDEKAAVQAYVDYWTYLVNAGFSAKSDAAGLRRVADGIPADAISKYVKNLRSNGRRTVGWVSINATSVTVTEEAVLLKACIDNGSYDVDAKSKERLEKGSPGYDAEAALRTISGNLVVTFSQTARRTKRCSASEG
ncbi:hypothetical protein [Kineosporia sp. A_224]|uniref:hypothetical protein n=1 Tax=Kineosporia sp. A_224 TaxID=1962180 RepID=UPI00117B95F1|nr:hypothetical protein [Kineosporia sp. A_224]